VHDLFYVMGGFIIGLFVGLMLTQKDPIPKTGEEFKKRVRRG